MDDYFPAPEYVPPPFGYDLERGVFVLTPYPPGGAPARDPEPAPARPAPPPTRYRTRYGVVYCETCGFAVPFCKGHMALSDDDRAAQDLARRAKECKGK